MLRLGEGGVGVKRRVLLSVFGKKPMNHQDNLVLTRRVMVIPRGLYRMKHGSTCPKHAQILIAAQNLTAAHSVNTCSYSVREV